MRHDLDAGDDRRVQPFGRGFVLVQHAVDAVPQNQIVRKRLQVNIAGLHIDGLVDDMVDQFDDRSFRRHVADVLGGLEVDLNILFFFDIADHAVHGGSALAVKTFNAFQNIFLAAELEADVLAQRHLQVVERFPVKRIERRQREAVVFHL